MTRLDELKLAFKEAIESNSKFIAVEVMSKNSLKPELIINPRENFKDKLDYYSKAYNDDLSLKSAPDVIRIEKFAYANALYEIVDKLNYY